MLAAFSECGIERNLWKRNLRSSAFRFARMPEGPLGVFEGVSEMKLHRILTVILC